jgi:hypothetical protein
MVESIYSSRYWERSNGRGSGEYHLGSLQYIINNEGKTYAPGQSLGYSNSDGSRSSGDICAALLLRVLLGWDGNRLLFSVARRGVLVVRGLLANYVVGDSFDSAGVDH